MSGYQYSSPCGEELEISDKGNGHFELSLSHQEVYGGMSISIPKTETLEIISFLQQAIQDLPKEYG